ncbi:hypothetical protein GGTG_09062 [Gaeumannomyces tritici R3-111a-1]|uniref:Uncharacterized protein n=1 Tax=Gaeumannomyces tritici (strain R3-111a-1) TaxID=644352 RepID=J3P6C1_GAET3|nr:hypothetical protein GGTG_09062 [Gaeumannomyces tritici R3-111a-1]EJT72195.1 hypothetical protein GGTG_09062 [Gaeumannomyces tritici R3-111a-1]
MLPSLPLLPLLAIAQGGATLRAPAGIPDGAYELTDGPRGRTAYRSLSGLLAATPASIAGRRGGGVDLATLGASSSTPTKPKRKGKGKPAAVAAVPTVTVTAAAVIAQANIGISNSNNSPAPPQQVGVPFVPVGGVVPGFQQEQQQEQQVAAEELVEEVEEVPSDARKLTSLVPRPKNEGSRQWPKPFPAVKLQCRAREEPKVVGFMPSDERKGREALNAYCSSGSQVKHRGSLMLKMATAQVYVCNTAFSGHQGCDVDEYDYVMSLLDTYCGPGQAGNGWFPDWAKTYGRDREGQDMCWGFDKQGR